MKDYSRLMEHLRYRDEHVLHLMESHSVRQKREGQQEKSTIFQVEPGEDELRRDLRNDCACNVRPRPRSTWAHFGPQHFCRLRFLGLAVYFLPQTTHTFSSGYICRPFWKAISVPMCFMRCACGSIIDRFSRRLSILQPFAWSTSMPFAAAMISRCISSVTVRPSRQVFR